VLLAAATASNTVAIAVGSSIGAAVVVVVVGVLVFLFVIRPRRQQRTVHDLDNSVDDGTVMQGIYVEDAGGNKDHLDALMMEEPMLLSHEGISYTIAEEDEEGFYDAEGYYHYYEDDGGSHVEAEDT
jgi:hypothetical protein